jgi:glycosyltransferase involved in cell wall biosynthesis
MIKRKKKILFQSDFALAKTGFGKNAKDILTWLYRTGKYEVVQYCCGITWENPEFNKVPWKCFGALPNSKEEIDKLQRDPRIARDASYGAYNLDRVIEQEKPDVYIAVQDIWGVDFAIEKPWFNKICSVIWTTLDSLPILETAVTAASKVKNYWIWSNFATKALHALGFKDVKTMHGVLNSDNFYRLEDKERLALRARRLIEPDDFVVGFVFRNQLRKSVPNLLEGYALWKKRNPEIKSKLLLHTHWGEGWNIYKLADEIGVDKSDIITTYVCKSCKSYHINNFIGQDVKCPACQEDKSCVTTSVGYGVSESQLNEIYNLMDVYCHPFTSGGQEIPIQEAKLAELITLVTRYSCGEEMCEPEAYSLDLDFSEYREHGTEFRKASTLPGSIAKQLDKVYRMTIPKRKNMGEKAREWVLNNFSVNSVGKKIEEFIDAQEFIDWDSINTKQEEKDPYLQIPEIRDDKEWLIYMYHNILKMKSIDEKDSGHMHWMQEISKGAKRIDIENYFRQVALQENQKTKKISFSDLLGKDDEGKRLLIVMPESGGDIFMLSSLFESIHNQHEDYNIYVATKPEYKCLLEANPYVYKVLDYIPEMDNLIWLEGAGDHKGFFEIALLPHIGTQRMLNYLHNGKDKLAFDIKAF